MPASKAMRPLVPLEEDEQMTLAEYLDLRQFCWCHVPNEGEHKPQYRHKQRLLGVKPGVPDVMIFDVPAFWGLYHQVQDNNGGTLRAVAGVAIELKRARGGKVSDEQTSWLEKLRARGWLTYVAKGAGEAIKIIDELWPPGGNRIREER